METPKPSSRRGRLIIGGIFLLLIFVILVRFLLWTSPPPVEGAARADERRKALATLHEEDARKLGTYGVVDQAKGQYQIPIERAMELTVAELKDQKPSAAGPVSTPAPAPSPEASPAASPKNSP